MISSPFWSKECLMDEVMTGRFKIAVKRADEEKKIKGLPVKNLILKK